MTNAKRSSTSFKKTILSALITVISIFAAKSCNASHADIGYRDGLMLSTLVKLEGIVYAQAEKYSDTDSFGAGVGYDFGALNTTLIVSKVKDERTVIKTQLQAIYYDVKFSYSIAIDYDSDNKVGYKVGCGYNLNEKVSAVINYSDNGLFVGMRKWF